MDSKEFTKYVNSFYGKKGVYPNLKKKDIQQKDVEASIKNILKKKPSHEFEGDSVDREFVRDDLIKRGILKLEEAINTDTALADAKHQVKKSGDDPQLFTRKVINRLKEKRNASSVKDHKQKLQKLIDKLEKDWKAKKYLSENYLKVVNELNESPGKNFDVWSGGGSYQLINKKTNEKWIPRTLNQDPTGKTVKKAQWELDNGKITWDDLKKKSNKKYFHESITEEKIDKSILKKDDDFLYRLLARLQSDCKYAIYSKSARHLWASGNPELHIKYMLAIWNKLPEKPEWLSMKQIKDYSKKLNQIKVDEIINEAKTKAKYKKGDKVNYIPKLSGLKNPLTVDSVKWQETDSLADTLGVKSKPTWVYSFKGNNLNAIEKDLKSAVNEAKLPTYHYKHEAMNDYFKGKLTVDQLNQIAKESFGTSIATKKELNGFLTNKFMQDVMADEHGIPAKTLVKRVRELIKFVNENRALNEGWTQNDFFARHSGIDIGIKNLYSAVPDSSNAGIDIYEKIGKLMAQLAKKHKITPEEVAIKIKKGKGKIKEGHEVVTYHNVNDAYVEILKTLSSMGSSVRSNKALLKDWQNTQKDIQKKLDDFIKRNKLTDY